MRTADDARRDPQPGDTFQKGRGRITQLEAELATLRSDAAEAATILSDLAGDITAAFVREPWRDQPGVGYCELQLGMAEASEYRALAARLAAKKGERG